MKKQLTSLISFGAKSPKSHAHPVIVEGAVTEPVTVGNGQSASAAMAVKLVADEVQAQAAVDAYLSVP